MYQQIKSHRSYIEKQLASPLTDNARHRLLRYHIKRVRDFQHERLIHLLVTLFFAFLFIGSLAVWFFTYQTAMFWPATILTALLFVLELAYIRHYYQLENGVQSLYELTEKLGQAH